MAEWGAGQGDVVRVTLRLRGENTVVRKLKNVENAFGQVGTRMTTFNRAGDQIQSVFKANATLSEKMGKSLRGLAVRFVGLQVAVGMAMSKMHELLEWFGESTTKFRDFDKRLAEVSTILGGDALKNTDALRAGIENLSKAYGKSANDLAEGTYQILSAAFDARDAINLLNTATKASIAGLTDVATSVDVFTSILNSYGKTVAQATQVSDILFQTVVRGKLRFEDLASAMGYITPIAANAGVAFEEIAAALSTVTRMGLHVDMATRGLALGIQDIIDPTVAASKAARQYEVDMSAVALRVKGLEGFINDLNVAMDEHGTSILPQMIRNMRSMRVFMALAGEEGVLGFAKDLDLLDKATGKTNEALTKMMNTAQMESDILAQSMEYLERRIGAAWHNIDIWWRKAQLWWGTFLSGGDANAAVREYEERVYQIQKNYFQMLKTSSELQGKPPLFQQLIGTEDMGKIMEDIDIDKVKEYFKLGGKIERWADAGYDMSMVLAEINDKFADFNLGLMDNDKFVEYAKEKAKELNIELENQWFHIYDAGTAYDHLTKKIGSTTVFIENQAASLQENRTAIEAYANYFISAFDDATETINEHIEHITELEYVLRELNQEVTQTYATLGGETFGLETGRAGKLGHAIRLFEEEMMYSRGVQYTNMAFKYGAEFINKYNSELEDAITTVHEFNQAQELANKKALSNNIEILKLQIKGMESRRGLNRAQERQMKKLEIANAKLRLSQMESEQGMTDAQSAIDEYYDRWSHQIFELKDIRDDELQDMKDDYDYKMRLVDKYTGWLEEEYVSLDNSYKKYIGLLEISMEEELDLYFQQYGINIPNEIQKTINKLEEYQAKAAGEEWAGPSVEATKRGSAMLRRLRESRVLPPELKDFLGNLDTGTYSVPHTGLYGLKRGETVAPVGSSSRGGGNTMIITNHNTIHATVDSRYGTERLARDLAALQSSGIIKNVGNQYRLGR